MRNSEQALTFVRHLQLVKLLGDYVLSRQAAKVVVCKRIQLRWVQSDGYRLLDCFPIHNQLYNITNLTGNNKSITHRHKVNQINQSIKNVYGGLNNQDYNVHWSANSRRIAGTEKSFQLAPEWVDGWCRDDNIVGQGISDLSGGNWNISQRPYKPTTEFVYKQFTMKMNVIDNSI